LGAEHYWYCSGVGDFGEEFEFPAGVEEVVFEGDLGGGPDEVGGDGEAVVVYDGAVGDADVFGAGGEGSDGGEFA